MRARLHSGGAITPRIEKDSLGPREVPEAAYYGIQTLRAVENFPVSRMRASPHLVRAYALLKAACADTNVALGVLEPRLGGAIAQAAEEVAAGKLSDQFVVDVFQAGAGTSFHMNVNEVLANRGLEILGRSRGSYEELNPNDHVNRGQSTNDTYPTAAQLAVLFALAELRDAVGVLVTSLRRKAGEFREKPKAGRTHLKDAMPVSLGSEFAAYATTLERSLEALPVVVGSLAEVPLGGSAVGTGVNTRPGFREQSVRRLAERSRQPLRVARDPFEAMQSRYPLAAASGWLRNLAGELGRIANDLRLLSSGPASGLDEIRLPEIQPGSSIMPAKVNPSAAECLNMICYHVVGADLASSLAVQAGQLEINVMMPLSAFEVLSSAEYLTRYLPVFARTCIDGIQANDERLEAYLLSSSAVATVLTPKLGYLKVAEVIHESARSGVPVKEILVREKLLSPAEVEELLGTEALRRLATPVS